MKPAPILLCLGTLSGGSLLGWRHAPTKFETPTGLSPIVLKGAPGSTLPDDG
ncbi:MAG: hypothetical protein JWL81_132, partial [Verrucomicrobiales bacterium]|nr:hypothetical protein [Verrucomicrobiales bacterium]